MKASGRLTETPISLEEVGVHEPIHRSASAPDEIAGLVEDYLADSLAHGRARGTVAYRRVYLGQLLAWLEQRAITRARLVTPRVLTDYLAHLRNRKTDYNRAEPTALSVKTLAAEASVLRSFFGWLAARRVVLFDPPEHLKLGDRTQPLPKAVLTEPDVRELLSAPGRDTLGLRDRAILETLYSTGLRRAELCALDLYDLDHAGELVRVRQGKGGRDRVVPIGEAALAAIRRYLRDSRPELVATPKEPALFVAAITHRRLNVKTLNLLVRKHAEAAGITQRVAPHVLRHTCATHLLRGGADIRHVQAILGHASVATTQIYTRVAVEDLALVHRRHHPRGRMRLPRDSRA
jgi:integrase/recombinase XerD